MRGADGPVHAQWSVLARLGLVALLVGAAGGCVADTGGEARLQKPSPTPRLRTDLSDADLWLSFERATVDYDGSTAYPDALGGPFVGRVVSAGGGRLERVPGADAGGAAVALPARCATPRGCPRALVEIAPNRALNPGDDVFEYGASVWLSPGQTTTGSNIMQKGRFGTAGGQWKLQVDNVAGEPSCVVRSGTDQLVVRSSVSISDSAWHDVVCRRDGEGLSISVDDTVDRVEGPLGSLSNEFPVRVGSAGIAEQDDHFHGRVDDVFLRIDPAG